MWLLRRCGRNLNGSVGRFSSSIKRCGDIQPPLLRSHIIAKLLSLSLKIFVSTISNLLGEDLPLKLHIRWNIP
jgi:hypothetical protein